MKEAVLKNLDEETVKVLSTKLKVWQKFDMLSNPCKSSLILESDTCRTEIPLNPDGSVKWFDDSKLVRHKEPENQKPKSSKNVMDFFNKDYIDIMHLLTSYAMDGFADLPDRIFDCLSDGYDDEEYREEVINGLTELLVMCGTPMLGVVMEKLCERIQELEA